MKNKDLIIATLFSVSILGLTITACQSTIDKAVRETKYSAYEVIGVEKRDLFKNEVKNVKGDQEEAGEAFKDALEAIQKTYGTTSGKLEKKYRNLNSAYEDAQKRANEVHQSTQKLETLSQDLFEEWRKEISQMGSSDLRTKSSATLTATQNKYRDFYTALKKSEAKMDPVLAKFKDQVLFLKHNLNAQAISGLKVESEKIQGDIESLMKDMNTSIQEAEEFIKTM